MLGVLPGACRSELGAELRPAIFQGLSFRDFTAKVLSIVFDDMMPLNVFISIISDA
jgi:hypothetical protein